MPAPRFIRIGAPTGEGPPPPADPVPAPKAATATPAAPATVHVLPPEVFGVWSEDGPPPPARTEGRTNGHGAGFAGHAPAGPAGSASPDSSVNSGSAISPRLPPASVHHGPVSPAPARGGRISHEDERLNAMRRSGRPVEAVCFDDLRVTGRLVAFDQYALILEADGQEIVLFKHGVIMVRCAESGLEDRGATSRGRRERAEAAKPDR